MIRDRISLIFDYLFFVVVALARLAADLGNVSGVPGRNAKSVINPGFPVNGDLASAASVAISWGAVRQWGARSSSFMGFGEYGVGA